MAQNLGQASLTGFSTPQPVVVPAAVPTPVIAATGRVLHVINGEHFSGAERVQQFLGKRLPEFGFDAEFACVKPGKFRENCGLAEGLVLDAPMRGRFDFKVVGQLARHARETGVVLLHAHTPRTALVASQVSRRTGIPWVYHVHSPTVRDSTRGLVNRINGWVESWAIRRCDRLITVSKSLRREMLGRGVGRNRLIVVPNGVAAIEPIDAAARMQQMDWKLGIVALMRPRKGVEVALDALAKIDSQFRGRGCQRSITLELIGGFETEAYKEQIVRQIESLGLGNLVHLSGFTRDVPSAIRRLDALLLPSLFGEGMPMVVLEALAAGVPVVATRVEGTPEVVRAGIEGLLAAPRDASDFADKILELISDRQRWLAMSHHAVVRHRTRFSDVEMARRVAVVYRRILNSAPVTRS